jgi:hypothetical protein
MAAIPAPPRDRLPRLIDALLEVHGALVTLARANFELEHGRVASSGELLGLLTDHQAFAWLRPLSSLIATLESESDTEGLPAALARTRSLFEPSSGPFADAYYAALQSAPEAVMAHARLRAVL